ncbi:MAG: prepilin-type N-terminal cleavage/methylation domain-containing protein [Deltaproteobacteria bacterium]|nr:prepilin-type N-terminal cleavage/methylation domain-containing protein [Deltaproteobacteria bacterium]
MKSSNTFYRGSGGFTLVEVLLASAILTIVIVALYGTLFPVMKAQEVVDKEVEALREIRRFSDLFSIEVRSAFYKKKSEVTSLIGGDTGGGARALPSLSFTTFTFPVIRGDRPTSDLKLIQYFTEYDTEGKLVFYKEVTDPYFIGSGVSSSQYIRSEVIRGVKEISFEFFNGDKWAAAWTTELEEKLPEAVRAIVTIESGGVERPFTVTASPVIRG